MPAANLARTGVPLSPTAADMLSEFPTKVADPAAMKIYAPAGTPLAAGKTLKNPDLADTLQAMAERGYRAFYTGDIARKFVAASQKNGGYFSPEDFAGYQPRFLQPLSGTYHGLGVFSSPPPLTGGTTLLASLKCLEDTNLTATPPRQTAYIDLVGRVLRQVYPASSNAAADVPDAVERVAEVLAPDNVLAMRTKARADDLSKKKVAAHVGQSPCPPPCRTQRRRSTRSTTRPTHAPRT